MSDFDTGASPPRYEQRLNHLAHHTGLRPIWQELDRTRHGWHLIVKWNRRLQPAEIIAIQAILGSDYKREIHNLMRAMSGGVRSILGAERWNLLYSSKTAVRPRKALDGKTAKIPRGAVEIQAKRQGTGSTATNGT